MKELRNRVWGPEKFPELERVLPVVLEKTLLDESELSQPVVALVPLKRSIEPVPWPHELIVFACALLSG